MCETCETHVNRCMRNVTMCERCDQFEHTSEQLEHVTLCDTCVVCAIQPIAFKAHLNNSATTGNAGR